MFGVAKLGIEAGGAVPASSLAFARDEPMKTIAARAHRTTVEVLIVIN
jgi:hypothetical protein